MERVIASWREEGGEPDVGADLAGDLAESGFEVLEMSLHTDAVTPADRLWQWPRRYVEVGAARLVELGRRTAAESVALTAAFEQIEQLAHARMILPRVIEVIARRR